MQYQKVQGNRLAETWSYQTDIATDRIIRTQYIDLVEGLLVMKAGFCFEPSGPTFKTKTFMRGACAHDAIYWLIRNGLLESFWKEPGDELLKEICLKDKMWGFRANYVYKSVLAFGDSSVDPANRVPVLTAP